MELDDYFEAYDRTHDLAGGSLEWGGLRRRVRRALARPVLELIWQIAFLFACLALGVWGSPVGYLLALGTLCFIPQHIGNVKAQIASISGLSSEGELQQHLSKEAQRQLAGATVSMLFYAGLALLFLSAGAVAAWMGKDFRPGLFSGLLVGLLSAYALFVRLPRASREISILGRKGSRSGGKSGDHHGN